MWYADILVDSGKAARLRVLGRDVRRVVMSSLANLSKYLGVYDHWRTIVRNHGLKWEKKSALETFIDIFESNLDDCKSWLTDVIQKLPVEYAAYEVFTVLTGLRPGEAVDSCKLIVKLEEENKLDQYLDLNLLMLKHFKYKDVFLRRSKNAYISFISEELLNLVLEVKPIISYSTLHTKLRRLGYRNKTKMLRKLHATTLRNFVPHEIVDLLQGRISQSIFLRFYYKPFLQDIRTKTIKGIAPLQQELMSLLSF